MHFVPVGSDELKRRIEILLAFIARGRDNAAVDPALITQSRRLFQLLIEPAIEEVGAAKRLLIVPDGPLRYAPFAALVLPEEECATWVHGNRSSSARLPAPCWP